MLQFAYLALDTQGLPQRGNMMALDLTQLERQLQGQQLYLVEARPSRTYLRWQRRVNRRELILLFANLHQLSEAGIPLLDCLAELRDLEPNSALQAVLASLLAQIEAGATLSQAMMQHPKVFSPIICCLVQVGEHSGNLNHCFARIHDSLVWQDEISSHTRNALLYPGFVAITIVAASLFLMLYLVPQLANLLNSMGQTLPSHTRALIYLSQSLQQYGLLLAGTLILLPPVAMLLCRHSPVLAYQRDKLLLRLWLVGPLLQQLLLARFTHATAIMYRAGINTLHCIELAQQLIHNRPLQQALTTALQQVAAGQSLSNSLQHSALFPSLLIRMLKVGENTGRLDHSLFQISQRYEQNIRAQIKQLQQMIEPCLTLILGLLLGWVVLAVIAPLYDMMSGLPL